MEQSLTLPNLYCDACQIALVKEYQVIRHYFQLIKRGIFLNYDFFVCKSCFEEKHRLYTLKSGYTIHREYPLPEL